MPGKVPCPATKKSRKKFKKGLTKHANPCIILKRPVGKAASSRGIAQLVEQRSPKPRAEGSNPSAPAMWPGSSVG